jgi:hypothetical protein
MTESSWGKKLCVDGDITISDCSRAITLDVSAETKAEKRNSIRKLNILIEALTGARDFLEQREIGKATNTEKRKD